MLRKLSVMLLIAVFFCSCGQNREANIAKGKEEVSEAIAIGDDIFAAKKKLESAGLRIEYGPDFPTKSEKYLMMVVDYGVKPSGLETFKYTVGLEGSDKLIDGVIKATPEGKITSIE